MAKPCTRTRIFTAVGGACGRHNRLHFQAREWKAGLCRGLESLVMPILLLHAAARWASGGAVWHIITLQVSILGLFAVLCNTIQTRLAKAALRAKRGHRAPRGGSVCRIGRRCDRASTAAVCRVESRRFRDGCGGGGRRCEGEGEGKGEEMIDGEECSERADGSVDDGSNASAVQCQLSLTSRGAAETRLALLYCGPLCA